MAQSHSLAIKSRSLTINRRAGVVEIESRPGLGPMPGVLLVAACLLIAVVRIKTEPEQIAAVLVIAATASWFLRSAISSRFALDLRKLEVTRTSLLSTTARVYDFDQVLLLEAQDRYIRLRFVDGTSECLSFAHTSMPQLQEIVAELCARAGFKSSGDVVVPDPQGAPVTFAASGIGLTFEGPIAILSAPGSLLFGRTTAVFDNGSRQVSVTNGSRLAQTATVPYRHIRSIGIEEVDSEAQTYRVILHRDTGRRIAIGAGADCTDHEINFIARQLSAFSGLGIAGAGDS